MNITLEPISLTKEIILSRVNEENIMEHYLGVPVTKKLVVSPLRKDGRPTASFTRSKKGELVFKDFGSTFYGNCFAVVMEKFGCSYYKALQIIANDFGIINRKNLNKNLPQIKYSNTKFIDEGPAIIQVAIRDFQDYELKWWEKYGISLKTLKKFNVYSIATIWLNDKIVYMEQKNQLVFGYYGGIREDVEQWRLYFPRNQKYRFLNNWKKVQLQGGKQLKINGDFVLVTKSLKDVMCLYEQGIPAIAPISENLFITETQYNKLKNKFKFVCILYDNDLPGIASMNRIRKQFPDIHVMYIPRKFKAKDISDFYKLYGKVKTEKLIDDAKQYIYVEESKRNKDSRECVAETTSTKK